jgi:tetratricopeptide (TPR) repeat protein
VKKELNLIQHFVRFSKETNSMNHSNLFLVKCYLRKGHALVALKDYGQAAAAFSKALEIDANCQVKIKILIAIEK